MTYLLISGIVALVFAVLLLFSPDTVKRFGANLFDSVDFSLDDKIKPYRLVVGIIFLLAAAWLFYESMSSPLAAFLHPIWVLSLIFGLLYLFLPNWVAILSQASNKNVFTLDEYILKFRKVIGVVVLVASAYIFYIAYVIQ